MPEAKALDLSLYTRHPQSESANRFSHDLASLSIEAEKNSPQKLFITPFNYEVDLKNQTVTSNSYAPGVDIRSLFMNSPEVVALANYSLSKTNYHAGRFGYIWISGPESPRPEDGFKGYSDSRLGIGIASLTTDAGDAAVIENFSGLNPDLSSSECLDLGFYASHFSPAGPARFSSISQLRDHPIYIHLPHDQDPLEYLLVSVLHRPDLYAQISSGQAHELYAQRLSFAQQVAPTVAVGLLGARSEMDLIRLGAFAETAMMGLAGIRLDGQGSGCGLLNNQLLPRQYSLAGLPLRPSEVTYSCPEIFCPSCNWKPSHGQLRAIESGTLTCCPNCSYNPATRTQNNPVYSSPDTASNRFYFTPPATTPTPHYSSEFLPEAASPKPTPPSECPWTVYFFTPWLDPDWISAKAVAL